MRLHEAAHTLFGRRRGARTFACHVETYLDAGWSVVAANAVSNSGLEPSILQDVNIGGWFYRSVACKYRRRVVWQNVTGFGEVGQPGGR